MTKACKTRVLSVVAASTAPIAATLPGIALAQDSDTDRSGLTTLDPILVEDDTAEGTNTNTSATGVSRLPATVRETPKVVNVVSQDVIREQNATSLEQVLRNVPGITMSSGEGRGGVSGDQFRIRGIASGGDIYTDGLRDFGVYVRDSFNTEAVQVIKGPSGEAFGVGNTGGVINSSTKRAHLGNSGEASLSYGSGDTTRATLDFNRQIDATSALRINLMAQSGEVPNRDNVSQDRQGLAIDYGTGIGTGTEWHLSLSHLRNRGTPDYGQSMAVGDDGISRPLLEYDIPGYDSDTSYVRSYDRDDSDTTTLSSSLRHDWAPGVVLRNETRFTRYTREYATTTPSACSNDCLHTLLSGSDVTATLGAGGGMGYRLDGYGLQNVSTADIDFHTGQIRHKAQVGLDVSYQYVDRYSASWNQTRDTSYSVLNPQYSWPGYSPSYDTLAWNATTTNVGLFAQDRAWFNAQWSLAGALRLDYFRTTIESAGSAQESGETTKLNPSIALMYEPSRNVTAYLSAARSYRPQGTDVSLITSDTLASQTVSSEDYFEPERADTFELGAKADLLDGRLGLSGALFQINKTNSYSENEDGTVGFQDGGRNIRLRGVELGASGRIAEGLSLSASYAYLDSELRTPKNSSSYAYSGNDVAGVPKHNFTLWVNYDLAQQATALPGQFSFGGGLRYASKYWANDANTAEIPETFALDAMIAYQTQDWRVALNAYNLTDHQNYAAAFNGSRAIPESGRSYTLSFTRRF